MIISILDEYIPLSSIRRSFHYRPNLVPKIEQLLPEKSSIPFDTGYNRKNSNTSGIMLSKKEDDLRSLAIAASNGDFPELAILLYTMLLDPTELMNNFARLTVEQIEIWKNAILSLNAQGYIQLLKAIENEIEFMQEK